MNRAMPEIQLTPSATSSLYPTLSALASPPDTTQIQAPRIRFLPTPAASDAQRLRTIRIALAGCGTVGGALVRLLHGSADSIAKRHGTRFEIARVLVRDPSRNRGLPLAAALFTNDLQAFLSTDCDVVVEAIGGEQPACEIALSALRRGKSLVTANKLLVALAGSRLRSVASQGGGSLDFGAAVGGSAPVISAVRDALGAGAPRSIRGILNGTSNLVLTLLERGESYENALAEARCRGLAEADCSRDLDGRDSTDKLRILAWEAFGIAPSELHARRIPLLPDPARLVNRAASLGGRLRLIAECAALNGREVTASVEPVILPLDSGLARTELEDNRAEVDCGWSAPLCVSGPGAGPPTATALLSDLLNPSASSNHGDSCGFVAVDDPREHRWLVSAYTTSATLTRECELAGISVERIFGADHDVWVTTAPEQWPRVHTLIERLELHGAHAVVARIGLSAQVKALA